MEDTLDEIPKHFIVSPEEFTFDLSYRNTIQDSLDFTSFSASKLFLEACIEYISALDSTQNTRELVTGAITRLILCPSLKKVSDVFKMRGDQGCSLVTSKILYSGLPPVSNHSLHFESFGEIT